MCYGVINDFRFFFFFNDTATTEIYTLSLHDALPISPPAQEGRHDPGRQRATGERGDRKSTRLNSSHGYSSYAVFCLKKKTNTTLLPPHAHARDSIFTYTERSARS